MKSAWAVEFTRIIIAFISAFLFGLVTNQWLLSVSIHSCIYISWNLYQLKTFERWISKGARSKSAPDTTGVWALIIEHYYRSQKLHKGRKKQISKIAKNYQEVMSVLPNATIVLNKKFEIEWANKPSQEFLGIDVVRDIGQPINNIIGDLSFQELLLVDKKQYLIEIPSPVDPLKALSIGKLKYGKDKILLIARDVSESVAIQKLRKAFIANASHELRTPLTVISGYLEILDSDEDLPSSVTQVISNAFGQAVRMEKILDDLLTLSKLEEKGFSKDSGKIINVSELLKRLVNDLKVTSGTPHIFELDIDESLMLQAVELEFYSLCQNLVGNAIKYSEKGSIICICWSMNNGHACLSVKDQGEGIAEEHLLRLTERFYRVNIERERIVIGSGLGLSIVKHILDNYGGHLNIESTLQQGSIFKAYFPESRTSIKSL